MTNERREPEVVSLDAYRAIRDHRSARYDQEVVTDVHFSITRSGAILPSAVKVVDLHVLAVLAWSLEVSSNMLDNYLSQTD
jgi:hypothetical protein